MGEVMKKNMKAPDTGMLYVTWSFCLKTL